MLLSGAVHAGFGIGLRGGLNFSRVPSGKSAETDQYRYHALSESYTGYHLGVMGQFVFPGFYIQPELLYSRTGQEMRVEHREGDQPDEFFTQKYDHLVIPINMGAKLGPLKLGAGPVFSMLLDDRNDLTTGMVFDQDLRDFTMGFQVMIGVNISSLVVDLKYEGSLTNLGERFSTNGSTVSFDTQPRQILLSIGFMF